MKNQHKQESRTIEGVKDKTGLGLCGWALISAENQANSQAINQPCLIFCKRNRSEVKPQALCL